MIDVNWLLWVQFYILVYFFVEFYLVGVLILWLLDIVLFGYVLMQGQIFDKFVYLKFVVVYLLGVIFDMCGWMIKGKFVSGWVVLFQEQDGIKLYIYSVSVFSMDLGMEIILLFDYGIKFMNNIGVYIYSISGIVNSVGVY